MSKGQVTVRFNRFPKTILETKEAVTRMVEKICFDIEAGAKVDAPYDTGNLQRSITTQVDGTFTGAEGLVFTNVEYAPYQEFGSVKNKPHPYMIPNVMKAKAEVQSVAAQMGRSIEKAAGGG